VFRRTLDQGKQLLVIDAIDDGGFGDLRLGNHDRSPLLGWWQEFPPHYWSVASAA